MAVREIVLMGDPVLREKAQEVEAFDEELRGLVRDLFETMYDAEGVGLAAPQIGVRRRVLVVDVREAPPDRDADAASAAERPEGPAAAGRLALVNPRVVLASDEVDRAPEGCLSIPGLEEVVERPARVEIHARDPEGGEVRIEAEELLGRALQHEIDHLDGILFPDRVSPLKRRMLLKKWRKLREEAES